MENPIPYTQLGQQVATKIKTLITEGKLKPGEWLRQEHLAREVGASHTPFREAVKLLVAEGLLEHLPHRGVRVIKFSVEDVRDIYWVRSILESQAAFEVAGQITGAELAELESLLAKMNAHLAPEDIKLYRELNFMFHRAIYSACRRQYLIRLLDQAWSFSPSMLWAQFAPTASTPLPSRTAADPVDHYNILQALRQHDAVEAQRLMREHIESAGRDLINAIESMSEAK